MRFSGFFVIAFFTGLILSGCHGDGGVRAVSFTYNGIWDVRYNVLEDQCNLFAVEALGFTDQHTIVQTGSSATLEARSNLITADNAEVEEDNTLRAASIKETALSGVPCEIYTEVSYSDLLDNGATSLFYFELSCVNGFICATTAVGGAERQESSL